MGLQSSRIIWGKNKLPNANEPTPVELYDENYIYINGNYAIKSDGRGTVAEDYHLYLCAAEETGGQFNAQDWKIQNGVKNWYLIAGSKIFKKGARTIKEDTRGDFSTLKLYRCIVERSSPATTSGWVPEEWEVVYQDVGLAWIPRDHRDVYYDDGKNKEKWHRLMWFVPEYLNDEKEDLEICPFEEGRQYHYGDRVLHWSIGDDRYYCYKYISDIPRAVPWDWRYWELEPNVNLYETYTAYEVGDQVIRRHIHSAYQEILTYDSEMYYDTGCYSINEIDRERDISQLPDFHSVDYLERLFRGETLYGLFKNDSPTTGEFDGNWTLWASGTFYARIESDIYWDAEAGEWKHGGEKHTIWATLNPNGHDIQYYTHGQSYEEGDVVIWTASDDDPTLKLYRCINPLVYDAGRPYSEYVPYNNSFYWEGNICQLMQMSESDCVYECIRSMYSQDNTHFIEENWKVITQKVDPNYGLYGVIWEKIGLPGGGGIPYYFPIAIAGRQANNVQEFRFCDFFGDQFDGVTRSKLTPGATVLEPYDFNDLYSCMKIKSNSQRFYAYVNTAGAGGNDSLTSVYISNNGLDWYKIETDYTRNTQFEIHLTDDGFLYLHDNKVYKVVIRNLEKYSETLFLDISGMFPDYADVHFVTSLINGAIAYRKSSFHTQSEPYYLYTTCVFADGSTGEHTWYINRDNFDTGSSSLFSNYNGTKVYFLYGVRSVNPDLSYGLDIHLVTFNSSGVTDVIVYTETREDQHFSVPYRTSPYYIDDLYAYFGYEGSLWQLDLVNGSYTEIKHGSDADGIIHDLPYYNNSECNCGLFTIDSLDLYCADINYPDQTSTVVNHKLKAYFYANDYYFVGHGGSYNGRPLRNSDLFISQPVELRNQQGSAGVYNLCVYLQDFDGIHFDNRTSFFWLSKLRGTGSGPFYGGPNEDGF